MTTVKAVLNRDREKKSGGYSLVIQIIHKRSKLVLYTPYVLKNEDFDSTEQKIVRREGSAFSAKQIKEMNRFVKEKKSELEKIVASFQSLKECFKTEEIIREYNQEQNNRYLTTFIEQVILRKEKEGKMGMAKALYSTKRSLGKFTQNRPVVFSDINRIFVKEYESFLVQTGVTRNTINFYMRNFRAIYNLAVESNVHMVDSAPFQKIHIRNEKTNKRALKKSTIEQIAKLDLTDSQELDLARDLFMFSFYARGMCFVDIIYLKRENIVDGVIYYKRRKTHQYMQVRIIRELQLILKKYHSEDEYVWPFMGGSTQLTLYKKYLHAYNNLHRNLKRLQDKLGLTTPLTMHVARHSWATLAKESGAHTSAISQGLGHTSEKTTEIYLKDFDNSVIDAVNVKVVHFSIC